MSDQPPLTIAELKGDSRLWTVEQMLERALADLRSGAVQANAALLIFVQRAESGSIDTESYYCNLTREQAIALLAAKLQRSIADWCD